MLEQPAAPADYNRLNRDLAMHPSPRTLLTAEPFFFPGGPIGCLLVHGFTGSPKEMRWMGEYLARSGFTILGVRLAGHATRVEDLARTRWCDWLVSVEDGWNLLASQLKPQSRSLPTIFIVGLSMGGALALTLASADCQKRYPVTGVVTISAPYKLPADRRLALLRMFQSVRLGIGKPPDDWQDPGLDQDHIAYPTFPLRSIAELRDLLAVMREGLPSVTVPVLSVHSHKDMHVAPDNMPQIQAALGSQEKEMLWVENSGHVIPREPDKEIVCQAIIDFIRRNTPQIDEP